MENRDSSVSISREKLHDLRQHHSATSFNMATNEVGQEKWEGTISAKLRGCTPDQVWPLLEDFFNFNKCFPLLDQCYGVQGTSGQPGCIRYCRMRSPSPDGSGQTVTNWAHEKLNAIDPVERSLTYSLLENNIGFNNHSATIKLLPLDAQEQRGCEVAWSFSLNPIEGSTYEDLVSLYNSALQGMAKRLEEVFSLQNN